MLVLLIMLLFDDGVIVNDIAVIVYNVVHISLFFNSIVVLMHCFNLFQHCYIITDIQQICCFSLALSGAVSS